MTPSIDEIKRTIDLIAVVRPHVRELRRVGSEHKGLCPFHQEKTASFTVRQDDGHQRFHCFGCGADGDVIDFLQQVEHLDQRGAIARAREIAGIPEYASTSNGDNGSRNGTKKAPKAFHGARCTLEREGWRFSCEFPYGPDVRKVEFRHVSRIQPGKNRPDKTFLWEHRGEDGEWYSGKFGKRLPLYVNQAFRESDQVEAAFGVEGEGKCNKLGELGIPAFSYREMPDAGWEQLTGMTIMLWPDKDSAGDGQARNCAESIVSIARRVHMIEPPAELPEAGDVVDAIAMGWNAEQILALADSTTPFEISGTGKSEEQASKPSTSKSLPAIHIAADLYNGQIRELKPVVEGLLYDGNTMMIGKPKDGKSWFALQLSIAIAGGREFEGLSCLEHGRVLFIALEEPAARTASRLRKLAKPGPWLKNLMFVYEMLPLMGGGAEQLAELIQAHKPRFVVMDTLTALVKASKRNNDVFRGQYEEVTRIGKIINDAGICGLLIHHARKGASDGPVEAIAGTGGIGAGIDAVWLLKRKPERTGTLEAIGREVEERTLALQFVGDEPFGWRVTGDGEKAAISAEREEILELLRNEAPLTPGKVAMMLRKNANTVRSLIYRLHQAGEIQRNSHGGYYISSSPTHSTCNSVNERGRKNEE